MYDNTADMERSVMKEEDAQIPRKRRHGIPYKATWIGTRVSQKSEEGGREHVSEPLLGFLQEEIGEAEKVR